MLYASSSQSLPARDENREIWRMLQRLGPQRRIEWLRWCCRRVSSQGVRVDVLESSGEVAEIWNEWASLKVGHGLSVEESGVRLMQMVRGKC